MMVDHNASREVTLDVRVTLSNNDTYTNWFEVPMPIVREPIR